MVDTGVDDVYMTKDLINEIGLLYKKEKDYVKVVNVKISPSNGIACGTDIRIGSWRYKVDTTVYPLNDRKFYLGMNFLDRAKAFIIPYVNPLFITGDRQAHAMSIRREAEEETVLPTL